LLELFQRLFGISTSSADCEPLLLRELAGVASKKVLGERYVGNLAMLDVLVLYLSVNSAPLLSALVIVAVYNRVRYLSG
jgi:hypothetical protein